MPMTRKEAIKIASRLRGIKPQTSSKQSPVRDMWYGCVATILFFVQEQHVAEFKEIVDWVPEEVKS